MLPKQILVIQTAFIGDVILATSLLETLHLGLPGVEIDIAVRKGNETLFLEHPFLRNVLIWDKKEVNTKAFSSCFNVFANNATIMSLIFSDMVQQGC